MLTGVRVRSFRTKQWPGSTWNPATAHTERRYHRDFESTPEALDTTQNTAHRLRYAASGVFSDALTTLSGNRGISRILPKVFERNVGHPAIPCSEGRPWPDQQIRRAAVEAEARSPRSLLPNQPNPSPNLGPGERHERFDSSGDSQHCRFAVGHADDLHAGGHSCRADATGH